jgi:flagellar basal-body rod protein FlgB
MREVDVLARLLDVADLRQRVIAQNVANVNTPGYLRMQVDFEDAFQKALKSADGKALQVEPKVVEGEGSLQPRVDGNNVDMDLEMAQLAKNTLMYQTFSQLLAHRVSVTRSAITSR